MIFDNEADLQAAIAAFLVSRGHDAQREVATGGGRVDILTERYLIEVKPKLSRSAQFQALGQLSTYDNRFPRHQKVIAGLTPSSTDSAYSTADRIRADGVEVWFMDAMPEFIRFCEPAPKQSNPLDWLYGIEADPDHLTPLKFLVLAILAFFLLIGIGVTQKAQQQPGYYFEPVPPTDFGPPQ